MNNVTHDLTLLHARVLACNPKYARIIDIMRARLIYLYACTYSYQSSNKSSSILQANRQPANAIANAKPSARAVWYSITSPPHIYMQPHKPHLCS